jgi:hypothetical protein
MFPVCVTYHLDLITTVPVGDVDTSSMPCVTFLGQTIIISVTFFSSFYERCCQAIRDTEQVVVVVLTPSTFIQQVAGSILVRVTVVTKGYRGIPHPLQNSDSLYLDITCETSIMKVTAFWAIAPCSLVVDGRFKGAYCLHHQGD